ncbi:hypothetical protein QL285_087333 [Trifolium repens]|nr:hypothetical protein QL285_087333 [Trifolium repens]
MAGGTPNNEGQQHANLQAAIGEIRRLQAEVAEIQREKADEIAKTAEEENIEVSQPLAQQLWDAQVPPNFKIRNSQASMEKAIHWNTLWQLALKQPFSEQKSI